MAEGRGVSDVFVPEHSIDLKSIGEKLDINGLKETDEFESTKLVKVRDLISNLSASDEAITATLQSNLSGEEKKPVIGSEASIRSGREANIQHMAEIDSNLEHSFEESDSMRRWKEMKRNGFLSGSLGKATMAASASGDIQKQQKSKRKYECLKKKHELLKKGTEPSGLLKELNPGIMNRIRNKNQVRSIFEAIIRICNEDDASDKSEIDSNSRAIDYSLADSDRSNRIFNERSKSVEDDKKLTDISENASSTTLADSANLVISTSLIDEAADIGSQWLELLHQDITGRLTALQKSKKRVENIVRKELPLLASRELETKNNCSDDKAMHETRWISLFAQINNTLSHEQRHLECWLNQVKEMQLYCGKGIRHNADISRLSYTDSKREDDGVRDLRS